MLAYALVVAGALILARMLAVSSRSGTLMLAAVVTLAGGLALLAPPRQVGDSRDHVAMATAIAHASAPPPSEVRRAWFYALTAAPFVRAAETAGRDPRSGFTALNLLLLAGAAVLLVRRVSTIAAVLLTVGPVLWWIDKPHPEVFTVSLIAVAFVFIGTAPWWSILALGLASAQEPALVPALAAALIFAALPAGFADRRVWIAAAGALLLAALNPLYQYLRYGVGLRALMGGNPHLPLARELLSTPLDPNIGIFVHAPLLTATIALALVLALVRAPRQVFTPKHGAVLAIGALFVLMFTQMLNMNGGGTPGPSRYGLWLLPVAIPILEAAPPAAALRLLTAASAVWCVIFFAPERPENYLQPTRLAAMMWQRWPAADNPLVEIFSERVSGSQPAPEPPLATPGCEKVLIIGRGSGSPTVLAGPVRSADRSAVLPRSRRPLLRQSLDGRLRLRAAAGGLGPCGGRVDATAWTRRHHRGRHRQPGAVRGRRHGRRLVVSRGAARAGYPLALDERAGRARHRNLRGGERPPARRHAFVQPAPPSSDQHPGR